jgi:hypothetical protein
MVIVASVIPFEKEWSKSTAPLGHGYQRSNLLMSPPVYGIKNVFQISVYSKEYTLPILLVPKSSSTFMCYTTEISSIRLPCILQKQQAQFHLTIFRTFVKPLLMLH